MKNKILYFKKFLLEKIEIIHLKISTHPKVIIWRLKFFGIHPFLGKNILKIFWIVLASLFLFSSFYFAFWRSPRPFPEQTIIRVERGEPLSQIANSFEEKRIVQYSFWLKTFIFLWGGQKRIIAGDYYFPSAISVFKVAKRLHRGEFGMITRKITVPEGSSSFEIAQIIKKEISTFDANGFIDKVLSGKYEGFLFPDTYFFMPNVSPDDAIFMMRENFARQIQPFEADIAKFKKPIDEVVIMASIIEDEANGTLENKRIVSGILWKRLRLKMPLQVDAPFQYYNGKNSYTLTKNDLTDNHEYNTYVNTGLPPTAITNPGLDSIRAAITPTNTEYLYFLSDKKGGMHYAKTFEEHKRNRELFLK